MDEPVYDFAVIRRDRTGEHVVSPALRGMENANPMLKTPDYFVSANDLIPEDHVRVQA